MAKLQQLTLRTTVQKWLNFLAPVLLFLAIIWLCWNLARVLWLLLAPPIAPQLQPVARQVIPQQSVNRLDFVMFEKKQEKAQEIKEPEPLPPVDIKINGVMVSNNSTQSSAMIEISGKVNSYRVGEMIDNSNYRLEAVNWDKVIVVDDTGNETDIAVKDDFKLDQGLNFDNQAGNGNFGSIGNNEQEPEPEQEPEQSQDPQGDLSIPATKVDKPSTPAPPKSASPISNPISNRSRVKKAVDSMQKDPKKFLNRMGVANGGNGYVVSDDMPTKVRKRLGFEMGDVVLSINGKKLTGNLELDSSLLSSVKNNKDAQIKIKRGEKTITLRQQF